MVIRDVDGGHMQGGKRHVWWTAAALAAVSCGLVGLTPAPAGAHARIVGSAPADGSVVERPPDRVTIYLDAKPATAEGDPIQVYGPTGARVDAGDARTGAAGGELSVGLQAGAAAGPYVVVYRIVSRDSHLIVGRLAFTSAAAAPAGAPAFVTARSTAPPGLRQAAPSNVWPRLLLIVGAGHLVGSIAARRRLRAHRA